MSEDLTEINSDYDLRYPSGYFDPEPVGMRASKRGINRDSLRSS